MAYAAKIGSWSVAAVPVGWEIVPDIGLRRAGEDVFPSNVVLMEEELKEGVTLQSYIENQVQIMQRLLSEPKIEGPSLVSVPGSGEARSLRVSYKSAEGRSVVQTQIYAGTQDLVGIVTFTTVEADLSQVGDAFKAVAKGLRFAEGQE
jgi:hypothetical protein